MQKQNDQNFVNLANNAQSDKEYPFLDGHVIVIWLDQSGVLARINQSLLDMTGYQERDYIGKSYTQFKHPDISESVYDDVWRKVGSGNRWKGVVKVLRKDGNYFWGLATIMRIQYQPLKTRYLCTVRKPSRQQIQLYREK
jgi:PAS domain S-box-containing protein